MKRTGALDYLILNFKNLDREKIFGHLLHKGAYRRVALLHFSVQIFKRAAQNRRRREYKRSAGYKNRREAAVQKKERDCRRAYSYSVGNAGGQ